MSTKSHTKNELARISAKIQQLKKKYPTSSELYAPTDKQNAIVKVSMNDESQDYGSNFQPLARNSLKQRSSNHNSRNSPKMDSNQNTDRSSKPQPVHTEFNPNGRFYEERKYHQSCNKKSAFNKENMSPFTQDLNYQKPFKEYKEELKNLKKQILSSLDFENFQLSKQKAQNTPKIVNNSFDTFSKNQKFNSMNNSFALKETKPKNATESNEKETPIQALQKNKHMIIKIVEENENSMATDERMSINHPIHQHESVKNYESHLSLEYLNEILQKLHEDFHSHKTEVSEKFDILDSQSESFVKQNSSLALKLQTIEKQMKVKQSSKGPSEFDMKMVEIQNQSVVKLSKQLHKEIELINAEINALRHKILQNEKSDSESESIEFSKEMMESYTLNLKEEMIERIENVNEKYENELKEFEEKFFRQFFDLKNELQLMGEKIKKEDYFQKTLKSLIPQTSQSASIPKDELAKQVKTEIFSDQTFILSLKSTIEQNISDRLGQNLLDQINRARIEVSDQILREMSTVNKSLKEIETKMVSYGILIENLEDGLKQLSNTQNDDQLEIDLISKIKEAVLSEICSEFGSKQFTLKQSILKERDSKAFLKLQNAPENNEENESEGRQVQICPIVNERKYKSNDASQVSIFTSHQQSSSDNWVTSIDEQANKKLFNSEIRYNERQSLGGSEKGKSFLLDQLVKNSLVFSALNH